MADRGHDPRQPRWVLEFSEGDRTQRDLLGGKGANLAEMTRLGLPVPPGFIVTTEACRSFHAYGGEVPPGMWEQVDAALANLEKDVGRTFGDPYDPLLVSVRSGAPVSMPGMMDTVLNLGLTDSTLRGLARSTGDSRFAYDSYRRLIQMFGSVVLGVDEEAYEDELTAARERAGVRTDAELDVDALRTLIDRFQQVTEHHAGQRLPQDPRQQLRQAAEAVFNSWNLPRAQHYRKLHGVSEDLCTAVNVQAMVFGNFGEDSATGVAFTRDPATGEPHAYGDWLPQAQGEDVVAGIRATRDLSELADEMPSVDRELKAALELLERHERDLCDVEFTIERGRLFILQTRRGKRSAQAAVRIAVDLVNEGVISEREALERVDPNQFEQLLHPQFAPHAQYEVLTRGLNASPGAAVGRAALTADEAARRAEEGEDVILVRPETSPDDIHGMSASKGILTSRGGLVSHAAVVARGMGIPAICGAEEVVVDRSAGTLTIAGEVIEEGELLSIDGTSGAVVRGEVELSEPELGGAADQLLEWADQHRVLQVIANADLAEDAASARAWGAEGIGLCRTEHMFMGERLPLVQRAILAADAEAERRALDELAPYQRGDFVELLEAMDGLPVTIRLLDPPLHEFLPDVTDLRVAEAKGELSDDDRTLLEAAERWEEANPMLGVRGCRLGLLRPPLYRMQVRAITEAAVERRKAGGDPRPKIMLPLIATAAELEQLRGEVAEEMAAVLAEQDVEVTIPIGTMIETPRAALAAQSVGAHADFFSFGTNDLTQLTFGFSRDDVEGRMMSTYLEQGLLPVNPFAEIDAEGVGRLIEIAVVEGRRGNAQLEISICGEHGGDPASIARSHEWGLNAVSCSPPRVPVARLAAARAAVSAEVRNPDT